MKSRSGALLKAVIASGELTAADLARELSVAPKDVDDYVSGDIVMPLPRQLCLALLLIERSPRFARRGHALHSQVSAAIAFRDHATSVHNEPPTSWQTGPRRRVT
jgi:hypothetical protein